MYINYNIDFDVIGNKSKQITTISMSPFIEEGQIRVVLSWPNGPKDLDLYCLFKPNRMTRCEVFFGKMNCVGVDLDIDNRNGGKMGVETITISTLGNYNYMFAVNNYIDENDGYAEGEDGGISTANDSDPTTNSISTRELVPRTILALSGAKITVYSPNFTGPVLEMTVPDNVNSRTTLRGEDSDGNDGEYLWWYGFCINGSRGINSIITIDKIAKDKPLANFCDTFKKQP
jgi:hypothetical protein